MHHGCSGHGLLRPSAAPILQFVSRWHDLDSSCREYLRTSRASAPILISSNFQLHRRLSCPRAELHCLVEEFNSNCLDQGFSNCLDKNHRKCFKAFCDICCVMFMLILFKNSIILFRFILVLQLVDLLMGETVTPHFYDFWIWGRVPAPQNRLFLSLKTPRYLK